MRAKGETRPPIFPRPRSVLVVQFTEPLLKKQFVYYFDKITSLPGVTVFKAVKDDSKFAEIRSTYFVHLAELFDPHAVCVRLRELTGVREAYVHRAWDAKTRVLKH